VTAEFAADSYVTKVPLRFGDFDTNGHVNNVAYFALLEQGRIAFLREARRHGPMPAAIIAHAEIDYLQSVPLGIRSIDIQTWVTTIGRSSFHLEHVLTSRAGRAATAASVLVVHDKERGSRPLSDEERATLARFVRAGASDG
jgi:acyl-CoA thioester hydrolase